MANWMDLPGDVLERISNLCIIPDQIRTQSVCKSWRSILKYGIRRELPWLMNFPSSSSNSDKEEEEEKEENAPPDADARLFCRLSKQKIYTIPLPEISGKRCCGSFQNGWLMIVDDEFNIFLFHPWSKRKIDLPHQSTFEDQNKGIYFFDESHDDIVRSAISDDGNVVVVVFRTGDLAFCRVGDAAYTCIIYTIYSRIDVDDVIDDVIYHKGQFYALSRGSRAVYLLYIEEGFPPRLERLTLDLDSPVGYDYLAAGYLVADILTDSIFVITRKVVGIFSRIHFDIHRVSLEEGSHDNMLKTFTKVESLGDRVVFLGYNSPMIVMASQFPGLEGNHIFFIHGPDGCSDSGVFSLEDGTTVEIFADRFHPTVSPPIWIAAPPLSYLRDFGGELEGVFSLEDGTTVEIFADRFHPTVSPPIWIVAPPLSYLRDFGGELEGENLDAIDPEIEEEASDDDFWTSMR